jgi:hypothetical protein
MAIPLIACWYLVPTVPRPRSPPLPFQYRNYFVLIYEFLFALCRCQDPEGGFGGGPGQLAHLAPTYAAVNALAIGMY